MQNFNNYNPYGYQQPQYQQPQYQQPIYQNQQLNTYAFVDGIEGAKAYQVRPNTMMLLMDSQQPICYKKQVNSVGQTIAFEIYDLVPHQDKVETPKQEYITRDEFNKEIADLKALLRQGE